MFRIIKSPGAARCCGSSKPSAIAAIQGIHLGPIDAFWHILNLFGPAAGLGLITPTLAKLLWRRDLNGVSWLRLTVWVFSACAVVTVAGLVVFGHDGKVATYAAMLAAGTLALWWAGFVSRSR